MWCQRAQPFLTSHTTGPSEDGLQMKWVKGKKVALQNHYYDMLLYCGHYTCSVKAKIKNSFSERSWTLNRMGFDPSEDLKHAFTRLNLHLWKQRVIEKRNYGRRLLFPLGTTQRRMWIWKLVMSSVFYSVPLELGGNGKLVNRKQDDYSGDKKTFKKESWEMVFIGKWKCWKSHRKSVLKGQIISYLYVRRRKRERKRISGG